MIYNIAFVGWNIIVAVFTNWCIENKMSKYGIVEKCWLAVFIHLALCVPFFIAVLIINFLK